MKYVNRYYCGNGEGMFEDNGLRIRAVFSMAFIRC